jgi:hypothetical protein
MRAEQGENVFKIFFSGSNLERFISLEWITFREVYLP